VGGAGARATAHRWHWRRVQALGGWSRALAQTWASPGRGDCDGTALVAQELERAGARAGARRRSCDGGLLREMRERGGIDPNYTT
jgi:hypothetical protein